VPRQLHRPRDVVAVARGNDPQGQVGAGDHVGPEVHHPVPAHHDERVQPVHDGLPRVQLGADQVGGREVEDGVAPVSHSRQQVASARLATPVTCRRVDHDADP